jgi:hypothetical protein
MRGEVVIESEHIRESIYHRRRKEYTHHRDHEHCEWTLRKEDESYEYERCTRHQYEPTEEKYHTIDPYTPVSV